MTNQSLYVVRAIIILDSATGQRILAKYYPNAWPKQSPPTLKDQKTFEKALWEKTKRLQDDILLFERQLVRYKLNVDILTYIVGSPDENELQLEAALMAVLGAWKEVLAPSKFQVEKRAVLENLDMVALCLDEAIDQGIVLEADPVMVASRVSKRGGDLGDIQIGDQRLSEVMSKARDQISGVWSR